MTSVSAVGDAMLTNMSEKVATLFSRCHTNGMSYPFCHSNLLLGLPDVTARGCKINGSPGCFLTDDGVYGCTCRNYLCNDFKMYKVDSSIFNELFQAAAENKQQ
jgi:hypothetical protein